ncbi:Ktr system potassium uptake protein D [Anaerobacillus alkalidiazotrophicus]|uniref:Ktr system potassium uptake protein D n=1 Tax=Anaerobacillus alkalidiazotrophicus TaxID=472963 RepID=A0A1S2MB61_9BACI|nr:TrkH family potassium uptake protein [Anaerobacillus alkalidiazotrophicus]OIJ21899.1 Ktr system potassium uptake protein D [Anaerobacillus alkalidiazotrophicus]
MFTHKKGLNIRLTSVQMIVLFYLGAVFTATILFRLPIVQKPGVELSLIDTIFTAVSAVSVTGLTVVSTADTFSVPGTFILAFVLQFGGIGIMTLGTFIWLILGKRIGLRERHLIMTDQNRATFSGLVILMKEILKLILFIELIGTIILGVYYLTYFSTWQEAFLQGFFAAVSATTNAGFDITGESLVPFANDYFVQSVNIVLLTLGAIGFPVLVEVKDFIKAKRNKKKFGFSLFTKITTITFFSLIFFGMFFILLFDWSNFLLDKSWHEKFFYSLFQSVTTRNGGLATMDVSEFSVATQLMLSFLMFVGASPSSVGGGIRTTTFAIILLAIFSFARGKQSVKIFHRELDQEDILKSFVVICVATFICGLSIIILAAYEPFPLMHIIFEVTSAFGTTGLSMGITPELSVLGKQVIIILMFIGRIGIFSFLFIMRGTETTERYHYPKEKVIIG